MQGISGFCTESLHNKRDRLLDNMKETIVNMILKIVFH